MKSFEIRETEDHITEEAIRHSAASRVPAGTVLMVTRSGILRHTFPVAVSRVPVTLNQDLKAVTPFGMHADFLAYALRSLAPHILHSCTKDGTTVQSIEIPALKRLEIPIAPREEQARVADALDELFSDLDAAVAALERVRAKVKLYRASVLKTAVEGALTAGWRAQHPTVEPASELLERIVAERRRLWEERQLARFEARGQEPPKAWEAGYRPPAAPEIAGRLRLPPTWCMATVDQLTAGHRSCAYGVLQPGPHMDHGVPLVRVGDIDGGRVNEANLKRIAPAVAAEYDRTRLDGGELLITLVGSIGRTAIATKSLRGGNTARAVGVVPLSALLLPRWVELWFRNTDKQNEMTLKSHEVARRTLNLEDVRLASVALPPLSEQEAIVEVVEDHMSVIDHLEANIEAKLGSAQSLRQAILRHAFSGKLVPQDPHDEPASELLKRIAAERETRAREAAAAKAPGKPRRRRVRRN